MSRNFVVRAMGNDGFRIEGQQALNRRVFLLASALMASGARAASFDPSTMGHLFISGFRGTKAGDAEVDQVRRMLETGGCAGVILLRRNCISPEQVSRLSVAFRDAAGDLLPVISVDQEGGKVARLDSGNGFMDWRSAEEISVLELSDDELLAYWKRRARELADVGINLNFAPVVDLNVNPLNPIIGKLGRSFGFDSEKVTRFASLFIRAHSLVGVRTSLKHFPGHGSSASDSHLGSVDVSATWKRKELEPFQELVRNGLADSVMNAHLLHPEFSDAPAVPASLSRRSVDAVREILGFDGAIFTDDMQMAAVEMAMPFDAAAIAGVNAGNTFLIYSNYRKSDSIVSGVPITPLQRDSTAADRRFGFVYGR